MCACIALYISVYSPFKETKMFVIRKEPKGGGSKDYINGPFGQYNKEEWCKIWNLFRYLPRASRQRDDSS